MKVKQVFGATPFDPTGLIPNLTTIEELNEFEAANITEALLWAQDRKALKTEILTATGLYLLHKKMFDQVWEWAGKLRKSQTIPGVPVECIQQEVGVMLGNVKYWIEEETFSIEEIAIRLHHKLVWIHPFPNGNGRWSRIVADLFLYFNRQPRFPWGPDDLLKETDARKKYIEALRIADDSDNYKPLLKFAKSK